MIVSIAGYVACGIIFWVNWLDIIPIITGSLFTIAYYIKDMKTVRYLCLPPNLLLVIFGILNKNYMTATLDFIEFSVLIVAILKFYIENKKEVKKS